MKQNGGKQTISGMIADLPRGLSYPTHLLTLLKRAFRFQKAAIFLPDSTGCYKPAAIVGFDLTTCNRIRVPADLDLPEKGYHDLDNESRTKWEPCFSIREYGFLETGTFFVARTQSAGKLVLFISHEEWPDFAKYLEKLSDLFLGQAETIAETLQRGAQPEKEEMMIVDVVRKAEEKFKREADENTPLRFVHVDLTPVIASLKENGEYTQSLGQELIRILSSMCLSSEDFLPLTASKTVLVLKGKSALVNKNLISHQIAMSLASFLDSQASIPEAKLKIRDYPADGTSFDSLLGDLSTKE